MPSEYLECGPTESPLCVTPGYWSLPPAVGRSFSDAGNVSVSLADGLASPKSRAAIALPSSWPGNHASKSPLTCLSHGIVTGPPVSRTTIVFGFAPATALISASWSTVEGAHPARLQLPDARLIVGRSLPSLSWSPTKTTATSAAEAAATASACDEPSA